MGEGKSCCCLWVRSTRMISGGMKLKCPLCVLMSHLKPFVGLMQDWCRGINTSMQSQITENLLSRSLRENLPCLCSGLIFFIIFFSLLRSVGLIILLLFSCFTYMWIKLNKTHWSWGVQKEFSPLRVLRVDWAGWQSCFCLAKWRDRGDKIIIVSISQER